MPDLLACIMAAAVCGVIMATVAVAACAAAWALQWLADKITEWWWDH